MKINPIMTILSLALAAVVGYALYSYCHTDELRWAITIAGSAGIFLTWASTMAVSLIDSRRNISFKVFNGIFAVLITALQFIFALTSIVSRPTYILCSGILLIIWLMIAYTLGRNQASK